MTFKIFFKKLIKQSQRIGNRGNAALVIFGLITVLSIILEFEFSKNSNLAKSLSIFRIRNSKEFLSLQVKANAKDPAVFRSTIISSGTTLNAELVNCIMGTGPSPCIAETEYPVTLFYPIPNSSSTFDAITMPWTLPTTPGAGSTATTGVYYDTKGGRCSGLSTATSVCPISIQTNFIAHCAGAAVSCAKAESIQIHYIVQTDSLISNLFTLTNIDKTSDQLLIADIMPPVSGTTTQNISVSTITVTNSSPTTVASTTTTPTIDPALLALITASGFTSQTIINNLANTFATANITDPNIINAMLAAGLAAWQGNTPNYNAIKVIGSLNITNPVMAAALLTAGVTDPAYAAIVAGSNVTDPVIIQSLIWSGIPSSADLNAIVAAVAGITDQNAALAIIKSDTITSPTVASALAAALAGLPAGSIQDASTAIAGLGPNANPATVLQIVNAISGVTNPWISATLAWNGVTNATLANTLASMVSVIPDSQTAANFVSAGLTDPTITQGLVNAYLANPPTSSTSSSSSTASSSSSSSSSSTSSASSSASSGSTSSTTLASSTPPATSTTSTTTTTTTTSGSASSLGTQSGATQSTLLISNCLAGQCLTPVL